MTEPLYDLSFKGDLIEGFFQDFVKADLQTLIKADDKFINALFSGTEQSIKRRADKATAIKFQQAFKKAGAKLIVRPHKQGEAPKKPVGKAAPSSNNVPQPAAAEANQTPATSQKAQAGELSTTLEAVPGESAPELSEHHQPKISAPEVIPNWSVSEPGAQLGAPKEEQTVDFDLNSLSVAELGADLVVDKPLAPAPPAFDLDSLSLAEAGATLDTLKDEKEPVKVDISHLSTE